MKKETAYTILSAAFCVCVIASNIFENVIFKAGPLTLTGGFLVFPIGYIINDCLSEIYGFKKARQAIYLAFGLNLAFVLTAQLVSILPESGMASGLADDLASPQQHFRFIFKADLRITAASMVAFVAGSLLNAKVMAAMKARLDGAESDMRGFSRRAILSSLVGEASDSLIFFPIAFHGIGLFPMITLMVTQIFLKTLYEIIVLPLTTLLVRKLKACPEA